MQSMEFSKNATKWGHKLAVAGLAVDVFSPALC